MQRTYLSNLVGVDKQLDKLHKIYNGEIKEGLRLVPDLDEYWRYKKNSFNIILGHSSTGKTTTMLYFFVLYALKYDLKFLIYSAENDPANISKKIIEFLTGLPFQKIEKKTWEKKLKWVDEHFKYIDIDKFYSTTSLLEEAATIKKTFDYDSFLIDPYNSLSKDKNLMKEYGNHEYDYYCISQMRMFTRKMKVSIYLVTHAVTESLRFKWGSGHPFEGHIRPPSPGSAEGGSKYLNKCDNFLIIHRYVSHPEFWFYTYIAVIKIKEIDTGGRPTPLDNPIELRSIANNVGFSLNGKNLLHLIKKSDTRNSIQKT